MIESSRRFRNIKLLYLARLANKQTLTKPKFDSKIGISPIYISEVYHTLLKLGFNVYASNNIEILFDIDDFDFVFSLYNKASFRNSEVFISSLCEYKKIAYLGASPNIRILAEDKHLAKILAKQLGIPTPKWCFYRIDEKEIRKPDFSAPYFIKPRFGAASRNINESSIALTWEMAKETIKTLLKKKIDVLLEQFIDGDNITIPIIPGKPYQILPIVKQTSNKNGNIITFKQKRKIENGVTREIYENITLKKKIDLYISKYMNQIQPIDYTRFDFRVSKNSKIPYFLEFNVCCNLGTHSTICFAGNSVGMSQQHIINEILLYSLKRQNIIR